MSLSQLSTQNNDARRHGRDASEPSVDHSVSIAGLTMTVRDGFAVVSLDKPRGNSLDEPLIESLLRICMTVEMRPDVRGVLITARNGGVFCPGFDLVALSSYDRESMRRFVRLFGRALIALYGLRLPVVAAIGGHAVAGGFLLTLTADLRILRKGAVMGLNDFRAGVPMPWPGAVLLAHQLAPQVRTRIALVGENCRDEEALKAGLCDEVCDAASLEERGLGRLSELASREPGAFALTKRFVRASTLEAMESGLETSLDPFLDVWFSKGTQTRIRAVVEALRQRV